MRSSHRIRSEFRAAALAAAAFAALSGAAPIAAAADWPGFRGPTADGHSPSKNVPTQWSEKENVRWKVAIHGRGWSSPVVLGNQVWVATSDEVAGVKEVA